MVFIHGGRQKQLLVFFVLSLFSFSLANVLSPLPFSLPPGDYMYGGAHDTELNGCNLLEVTGNALVVTIQYRLGVFGFLGSDRLRSRDVDHQSTGNYGLLDQIESLKWLRDNIGSFGGNSGNVMIFGESAGAGSVTNLLVSPLSTGLYHRASLQSGAFAEWTTKTLDNATEVYDEMLVRTGCASGDGDGDGDDESAESDVCLAGKDADELLSASLLLVSYPDQWTVCRWAPTIDGVVIREHPLTLVETSPTSIRDVPIMYGNNDEEGVSFLSANRLSSSSSVSRTLTKIEYDEWLVLNFPNHHALVAKT